MVPICSSEPQYAQHRFEHPRERVFRQWLSADAIAGWFGDPLHDACDIVVDARIGGEFSLRLVPKQPSGTTWRVDGRFADIQAPNRLEIVLRWTPCGVAMASWQSRIVATFTADGGGTLLSVAQSAISDAPGARRLTWAREVLSIWRGLCTASPVRVRLSTRLLSVALVSLATLAASLSALVTYGTFRAALPFYRPQ
jgi:uncharacterized protein YndB with AHSA1/START domain